MKFRKQKEATIDTQLKVISWAFTAKFDWAILIICCSSLSQLYKVVLLKNIAQIFTIWGKKVKELS